MVKLPSSLATRTRAPIISVPPVAPKRHSASQKAASPLPRTSASPCSVRTGNRGQLHSLDVHQDPVSSSSRAPRLSKYLFSPIYLQVGSTLWANKRCGERPHQARRTKDAR